MSRHMDRARLARDSTKIDDRSQPSTVAALSHHCMKMPSGAWASGCHVDLWSSDTSGMTVSMAYRSGLKQRIWPLPQASAWAGACGEVAGAVLSWAGLVTLRA